MPKDPEHNFLKAWREHRRMTQAALAKAINTNGAVISLLENGQRRMSDKWLRRIAPVLRTTPGQLLDYGPGSGEAAILAVWAAAAAAPRPNIEKIA